MTILLTVYLVFDQHLSTYCNINLIPASSLVFKFSPDIRIFLPELVSLGEEFQRVFPFFFLLFFRISNSSWQPVEKKKNISSSFVRLVV